MSSTPHPGAGDVAPSHTGHVTTVATPDRMRELGQRLAKLLRPGDLVLLTGELGAGKTTLARGLGEGLGVRGAVTSPTFVIARAHPSAVGGPPLVHADAYRLSGGLEEMEDLDLDVALSDSVVAMEWGEGRVEELSEDRLHVVIERTLGAELSAPSALAAPAAPSVLAENSAASGVAAAADGDDVRRVVVTGIGARWEAEDLSALG